MDALTRNSLLEPPVKRPHWLTAIYRRLVLLRHDPAPGDATDPRQVAALRPAAEAPREWTPELAHGVGSPRARLAVVGERAPGGGLPFRSRSGLWLWRALRHLGWDELTCWLGNAYHSEGSSARREVYAALGQLPELRAVLVLGRTAENELGRLEDGLDGGAVVARADHPQAWARFRRDEGAEGYAAHLVERGLPRVGPPLWPEVALRTGDLPPTGDAEADAVPCGVAYRPVTRTKSDGGSSRVSRARADKARKRYVEGDETLKQVAAASGIEYTTLCELSRREDWPGLRAAHALELERVRREAHLDAARAAASANARKLAEASTLAIEALSRRVKVVVAQTGKLGKALANPEAEVDPRTLLGGSDVRALAEAVALIRDLQTIGGDQGGAAAATLGQARAKFAALVRQFGEEAALDMIAGEEVEEHGEAPSDDE